MIADTTFASDLIQERRRGQRGPASNFLARRRAHTIRLTIITAGEISVLFDNAVAAWEWLQDWSIYRLHRGIMDAAADIDRELTSRGERLGENDNWIAGFAFYYGEPLVTRDLAFDRVSGIRPISY
jgi:predicted nucleic acid-binding protein